MTQDEIIEMVRQSDLGFLLGDNWMMHHEFEAFAKLVATRGYERGFIDGMQKQMQSSVDKAVNAMSHCTWVGLTDDEMEATFIECGGKWNGDFWKIEDADFHPFLRTIEAKLKEKNT